MALPKITINRGQGGLGRPLASKDHISGFVMPYTNAGLPSGFATDDRIKKVFSIEEAEALGIVEGGANTAILWYHINQYFAKQPKGELFINLIDNTSIDYSEVVTVQEFANGEIRQLAFYDGGTAFATATLSTLQGHADTLEAQDMPLSILYAGNFEGISDIASLDDLRALSNKSVSVVIGEDGSNAGAALRASESQSITAIGTLLGVVSEAQVHLNVGWVGKYDLVDGLEFDEPALALSSATVLVKSQAKAALDSLNDKGYIFIRKQVGTNGSYFNDSHTAIAVTSDFAYIENNRTMDKAVRGVRTFLLPNLNSPLYVNPDGTLTADVIAEIKNDASKHLEQMERDGELSAFEVIINPEQDVLTTSQLSLAIVLVPVGVGRQIVVNIGFAVKLSNA